MAFGPADRDGTNQNKDRTTEGSVSQIVGHRPGRHFPIITGPSNRHNHYQRQIGVNSVGTYSGHCRRSGWTVWAVGWFPLFVGYFMSEWVFR